MKLVFCGTPDFAVPTLRAVLAAGHQVSLVLTQPDRPAGRKMELQASPVKRLAVEEGLTVQQPDKLKYDEDLQSRLRQLAPDAILVVAYGRLIPQWMLDLPRFGNLNLHGSLLPKYRGAAPIQWAVANGEMETGITTMRLDAGLDTGDVLLESRRKLRSDTMASELFTTLSVDGAELMLRTLSGLEDGSLVARPQNDAEASLAPILTREDGHLRLKERSSATVYNRWRGFYPWPGAWAQFRQKRFLVHKMQPHPDAALSLRPCELQLVDGKLLAGTADGTAIHLVEVQLEGKPRLSGEAFARDYQLRPGEMLE